METQEQFIENLKAMSKDEIHNFIRHTLSFESTFYNQLRYVNRDDFEKEHYRFNMSGYDYQVGSQMIDTTSILNKFANLGIYDFTHYLFLDFYKGSATLYLKYWQEDENLEIELDCFGTVEIIHRILELTIFTDKIKRRRC